MSRLSASVTQPNYSAQLGQIFFQRVGELGERTFLKVQRLGSFEDISWRDFGKMVQNTLLGLHALGSIKGTMSRSRATTVCPGYPPTWRHWLEGCRTWWSRRMFPTLHY
jgi:hypothetical protein